MAQPTHMVIERFRPGCSEKIYARFHAQGRMLPAGLAYVESWLSADACVCFQLMATSDPALFDEWIAHWDDLCDFQIVPLGEKPAAPPT